MSVGAGTFRVSNGATTTVSGNVDVLAGATFNLQDNLRILGGSLTNAGSITSVATSSISLTGTGTLGGSGTNTLPHLILAGSGQTTTLGGAITVQGQLTNSTGHTLDANASGHYSVTVSSNWYQNGSFTSRNGEVIFASTATLTGSTTFYSFTANTPGITLTFTAGTTQWITNTLTFTGEDLDLLRLRSTSGTQFCLRSLGTANILYVDVSNSRATGNTLNASASTNSGNNTNWTFGSNRVWDGSASTLWNVANNWTPAGVPGALDTVTFNNTAGRNCDINLSTTVAAVTIAANFSRTITAQRDLSVTGNYSQAAGAFNAGSTHITVGGSMNLTGGSFSAGTSTITFNSTSAGQTIRTNGQPLNHVIFDGSGGEWTLEEALTVSTVTITAGLLNSNASGNYGITVSGNWMNTGGSFVANQSTVTFTASTTGRTLRSNGSSFSYLNFNGSGGAWTLQDALTAGQLTMTQGTLDTYTLANLPITITGQATWTGGAVDLNASSVTVAGNWTRTGTLFTLDTSTVVFIGSGNKTINSGAHAFYNLQFNGSGGVWSLATSSLTVQNAFSVQTGTLTLSGVPASSFAGPVVIGAAGTWVLDADAEITAGSFSNGGVIRNTVQTSTLTVTGVGTLSGNGSTTIPNLRLQGAGTTTTLDTDLLVSGRLTVATGHTLNAGSRRIDLLGRGTPFVLDGSWAATGSTVTYRPSTAGTVTVSQARYGTLHVQGTGSTFNLGGPITTDGNLSILAGSLNVTGSDHGITVGGNWSNSDSFSANAGSITFTGSTALTVDNGASNFYRLRFAGSGQWTLGANSLTAMDQVQLAAGSLIIPSGSTMTVLGSVDVSNGAALTINSALGVSGGSLTNAGSVIGGSGAVVALAGTGSLGGSGSTQLPNLTLTGSGQTTTLAGPISVRGIFTNQSGHTLDAHAVQSYAMTVSSSWANSGTFTARQSSVTFDGSSANQIISAGGSPFYVLSFTGSGNWDTANGALTLSSAAHLNAGTLTVASGSSMTVTNNLHVKNGATLNLNENLSVSGGTLSNAGTISALSSKTLTLAGTGLLGGSGSNTFGRAILSGSGQTTLAGPVTFTGLVQIGSGHTLDVDAANHFGITISSAWMNSGTFEPRSGTVEFTSDAGLIGNTTFYSFTATTPGITLTFAAGSTQYVTNAFTITGATGNTVKLRSSANLQQFYVNSTGAGSVSYANVKDSNASGNTINASASTDATGNTNWTFGTNYVWIGPGNFSEATNWSPTGNPGPLDSVRFNNTNNCTIDISTTVTRVTIDAGYTGTITAAQDLRMTGDFIQAGGRFAAGQSMLTVGANWTVTGGVFEAQSSSVIFNSNTSGRTITTTGRALHNAIFSGSGGYWTLQDSMTVISSMTLSAGTLDVDTANHALWVGGNWTNDGGIFTARSSTVTFAGAVSGRRIRAGTSSFGYVRFTGAGTWQAITDPWTATGEITIEDSAGLIVADAATLTAAGVRVGAGSTMQIRSDVAITNGVLTNAGSLTSYSTATLTLAGTGTLGGAGSTVLPRLDLSGAGTTTLGGPITVQGAFTNAAPHSLDANNAGNYGITLSSAWINSGTYLARASSVTLTGTGSNLSITTAGWPIYFLRVAGAGSYRTSGALTVSSSVIVNAGSLTVVAGSSATIGGALDIQAGGAMVLEDHLSVLGGGLRRSGSLTFGDATIITISGTGEVAGSGPLTLPHLVLSGAGTTTIGSSLTIRGGVTNGVAHTLDANGSNGPFSVTVSSSWVNSGSFIARTSSLTFSGTDAGLSINGGSSNFYTLRFVGSGGWRTAGSAITVSSMAVMNAGTLTVATSSLTVLSTIDIRTGATLNIQADLGVLGGSLTNAGTISSVPGTVVTLSGAGNLGGNGSTILGDLILSGAGQTTTLASAVTLQGNLTNSVNHSLNVGANYPITLGGSWSNAGTYAAQSGSVTFNGSSAGLTINSGNSNFYALGFVGSGSWQTSGNPLTTLNDLNVNAGTLEVAATTMTVGGNITVQSGATLSLQNNLRAAGGSLTNAGTVNSVNTSSLTVVGTGTLGGGGSTTLPHLILVGSGQTTTLGGDLVVQGQMTNSSGHTLDANNSGNYSLTVSSNWASHGTFVPRTGSVVFNSTATLAGNTTFYNFVAQTPGITLSFTAGTTQYVTGPLSLAGDSTELIRIRSTVTNTRAYLRSTGSHSILFVDVQDSGATGNTLNASASTNSGNNVNWTFGTTRVWDGSSSTAWNLAANWTPAGVPGALESVVFDNTATRDCVVNLTTTVAQVSVQSNFTRLITFNTNLTVASNWSQANGTVAIGTNTFTVGGSWTKTGGSFNPGTGRVVFNSTLSGQTITPHTGNFYDVVFSGLDGYWTLQGSMTVVSTVTLTAGTLDTHSSGNYPIAIGGDWTNNGGTYVANGSTMTFNGTAAGRQITSNGGSLGHLNFNGSNGVWTLQDALTAGNLTLSTGTLNSNAANHAITLSGHASLSAGVLTLNASQMSVAGNWTMGSAAFNHGTSTITFSGASGSTTTLTGSTTFYHLSSTVAGKTLRFANAVSQTINGVLTLRGGVGNRMYLRSTSEPVVWFIRANGDQNIAYVDVKDSYASGNTLYAGQPSRNVSGNTNWVFNYVPAAVADLAAEPKADGSVTLTWRAPLDADDNPLGVGSQFAIQWSTWSVTFSTSSQGDTGYTLTHHVYISTSAVPADEIQVYISTGLSGNMNYNFRLWTRDPLGYWSAISNAANATVTPVLSVALSTHAYNFGAVNLGATTISTTVVHIANTGNVVQTYSLSAAPTGAQTVWTLGGATPTTFNTMVLEALFNSTQPANGTFSDDHIVTGTPAAATGIRFAGNQTGVSAPVDASRQLWIKLLMPLSSSTTDQQAVNVTVTATE